MYYTTSGSYRKSKMVIDYLTIALTVAICVMFIIIIFLRSKSGILFPLIFFTGAVLNGLCSAKNFMNKKRLGGFVLLAATLVLLLMSAATFITVMR
jgi:hypothetical protein